VKIRHAIIMLLVSLIPLIGCETTHHATTQEKAVAAGVREVVYTTKPETLKGYLCRPSGAGPFPAVLYNHGGLGDIIGGLRKKPVRP
jgi:hypothetical protein